MGGHWVLAIGFVYAGGHEPLVVSNDPWNGVQRIQTYNTFLSYVGDKDPQRPWVESAISN